MIKPDPTARWRLERLERAHEEATKEIRGTLYYVLALFLVAIGVALALVANT